MPEVFSVNPSIELPNFPGLKKTPAEETKAEDAHLSAAGFETGRVVPSAGTWDDCPLAVVAASGRGALLASGTAFSAKVQAADTFDIRVMLMSGRNGRVIFLVKHQ